MNKFFFESLHGHTTASDGVLIHKQVLDECIKNNIGIFAFTDHDTLMDPEIFARLKRLHHKVKFISGIEVSCDFLDDPMKKISTFHVTGLFVDPTNKALRELCDYSLKSRDERLDKFITNLKALGFEITKEEVLKISQGAAVGRPHMVKAVSQHEENIKLLNKFHKELIIAAKNDELRKRQLKEIESAKPDWRENTKWFTLVFGHDSLHSVYAGYHETIPLSLDEAVKLIRGAGGLAQLAHWSYSRDDVPIQKINELLQKGKLDGMETVYAFGVEKDRGLFEKDMADLSSLCKKYHKIEGGGGDFHKPEDFALMIDPRFSNFAQRTKGMVEEILKLHPNLDLTWSTIS